MSETVGTARSSAAHIASGVRLAGRLTAAAALLLGPAALGGTIDVRWDPVFASDLAGYRVYYGTDPSALDRVLDVTSGTSATLTGLDDCQVWYTEVRAYDTGGLESESPSNVVEGLPRPQVSSVSPTSIVPGDTVEFTISGINFDAGDATDARHPASDVDLSHAGLSVVSVTVDDCKTLRVKVQADAAAAPGTSNLDVLNADTSHADPTANPRVFGRLSAAIQVLSDDIVAPTVAATTPAAGAGSVSPDVRPTISFSEAVDPGSVSPQTVRLLDAQGAAVAQAAGSPQVDGKTVTIFPAQPLSDLAVYQVEAKGGASGVSDLAGNPLTSDFLQTPGFAVRASENDPSPREFADVVSSWPYAGQNDVAASLNEVRVTFDRDMTPLFDAIAQGELTTRFTVTSGRTTLPQAAGSPRLEGTGDTVVITLAAALQLGQAYATTVQLADDGFAAQLQTLGLSAYGMEQMWTTRPSWRVEGGLESASYRDPGTGDTTSFADAGADPSVDNANVPADSEFLVTFDAPVAADSQTTSVFRLLARQGRRYVAVDLSEPLKTEDGGRTVVLTPLDPLPSGIQVVIDVRTGPHGVVLEGDDGPYDLGGGSPIQIQFATEVSGQALDATLAVGDPRPLR